MMSWIDEMVEFTPVESDNDGSGLPYVTHEGTLRIGDHELRVYQLNDGQRVIDAADMQAFFGTTEPCDATT
jgi:hypothetical protein